MSTARETLEVFANPAPDRSYEIEIVQPEFNSVCPKTGHPDFATITLRYEPAAQCVELKSYKLYLQSFRNVGAFYEDITNRIRDDLVAVLQPRWLELRSEWTPRGGISTTVAVSYRSED